MLEKPPVVALAFESSLMGIIIKMGISQITPYCHFVWLTKTDLANLESVDHFDLIISECEGFNKDALVKFRHKDNASENLKIVLFSEQQSCQSIGMQFDRGILQIDQGLPFQLALSKIMELSGILQDAYS